MKKRFKKQLTMLNPADPLYGALAQLTPEQKTDLIENASKAPLPRREISKNPSQPNPMPIRLQNAASSAMLMQDEDSIRDLEERLPNTPWVQQLRSRHLSSTPTTAPDSSSPKTD